MEEKDVLDTRKPKLTIDEQIAHLRAKGVTFDLCGEDEAARILAKQDHYFRLAAYRILFPKRIGGEHDGEYAELDFAKLADLAEIDQELRGFLLPLTLDVESAAKTWLITRITDSADEDGYSIFSDYLSSLNDDERNRRRGELKRLEKDLYLGPLVERYPIEEMPAWVFLELSSFGAFTNFYLFCANRWDDAAMRSEHYLLRCANSVRNAAAHSSAIINGLGSDAPSPNIRTPRVVALSLAEIGLNKRARRTRLRNPRVLQMTILAFAYDRFVPQGKRDGVAARLNALEARACEHADWYAGVPVIGSSYRFLSKVFDEWLR